MGGQKPLPQKNFFFIKENSLRSFLIDVPLSDFATSPGPFVPVSMII